MFAAPTTAESSSQASPAVTVICGVVMAMQTMSACGLPVPRHLTHVEHICSPGARCSRAIVSTSSDIIFIASKNHEELAEAMAEVGSLVRRRVLVEFDISIHEAAPGHHVGTFEPSPTHFPDALSLPSCRRHRPGKLSTSIFKKDQKGFASINDCLHSRLCYRNGAHSRFGTSIGQTELMVYRGGMPASAGRPPWLKVARRSPIWPNRESSPQRTPIFLLWRSRGTIGWVRATPGALPTAPASMDGPDGRGGEIPGVGKGLILSAGKAHAVHDI